MPGSGSIKVALVVVSSTCLGTWSCISRLAVCRAGVRGLAVQPRFIAEYIARHGALLLTREILQRQTIRGERKAAALHELIA